MNGRDYFFDKIGSVMEDKDIYIISADLAGRPFDYIRKEYPDRFVPVGISEQNLISVACGMAMSGKRTIAYAANPFIVYRAFDQIRNSVSLMDIPVTIAGFGVGFGVSVCGTTHFTTEDFSMMSLCPNMKIVTVSDNTIAEKAFGEFLNCQTPTYLRFDKQCGGELGETTWEDYSNGFRYIQRGGNILFISTGYMSQLAKDSAGDQAVMDLFSYPFNSDALIGEIEKYRTIVVCEEQQKRGGLGSTILELMNERNVKAEVRLKSIDYGERLPSVYGSRSYWLEKYGLNSGGGIYRKRLKTYYHNYPRNLLVQARQKPGTLFTRPVITGGVWSRFYQSKAELGNIPDRERYFLLGEELRKVL